MSDEKSTSEARRWLAQAQADIRAARISAAAGSHEWACFQSQQAGEKALKAIWMSGGHDPWGHSLVKLVLEHPGKGGSPDFAALAEPARLLDKLYIPTRYPNGLPDLTPSEVYGAPDSAAALEAAERFIAAAVAVLR